MLKYVKPILIPEEVDVKLLMLELIIKKVVKAVLPDVKLLHK